MTADLSVCKGAIIEIMRRWDFTPKRNTSSARFVAEITEELLAQLRQGVAALRDELAQATD